MKKEKLFHSVVFNHVGNVFDIMPPGSPAKGVYYGGMKACKEYARSMNNTLRKEGKRITKKYIELANRKVSKKEE